MKRITGKAYKKKNNNGFTFIEVVISVAMVAFIFIALSRYISSSVQTNARARRIHRASLANQLVLEEIKGYGTLSKIAQVYNNSSSDKCELVATGGAFEIKSPASWDNSTGELEDRDQYYFLRTINVEGAKYKVLIKIDSNPFDSVIGDAKYNQLEIPQAKDLNGDDNAIILDRDFYRNAGKTLLDDKYQTDYNLSLSTSTPLPYLTDTYIESQMRRKLFIEIDNAGGNEVRVTAFYKFYCNPSTIPDLQAEIPDTIFYEEILQKNNLSIYYFFNLMNSGAEDLCVNNYADCKVNLYLVRQDDGTGSISTANVIGTNIGSDKLSIYTNVNTQRYSDNIAPNLIQHSTKKRLTKVSVAAYMWDEDELLPENAISEMETTRGE